jgi:hypothetical protein
MSFQQGRHQFAFCARNVLRTGKCNTGFNFAKTIRANMPA